jgi:hypothetical protein
MPARSSNFFFLLLGLLVLLLLAPIASVRFENIISLAYTATLMVGVWSLARNRLVYIGGWGLALLSLALSGAELSLALPWTFILSRIVAFAFCLLSILIVLREVLYGKYVDANRIAGAVCVYLLLGLNWAFVYSFLYAVDASSFVGLSSAPDDLFLELLYYSFVTLTTLGYGDISPGTQVARALAYLQAVSGVMYVAILIASLIGSFRRDTDTP